MPKPPERILLLRSGRHLRRALDALALDSPGCEVTVVGTPAAVVALDEAKVPPARRLLYERTPFFQPWPFITSATGQQAWRQRFDRVCVLWSDPDGVGHANVDRTALLLSPGGFTAITADGRLLEHRTASLMRRELSRAIRSLGLAALLGLTVFLPARLLRPFRTS